jgi:hypothetical protein
MTKSAKIALLTLLCVSLSVASAAQKKQRKPSPKKPAATSVTAPLVEQQTLAPTPPAPPPTPAQMPPTAPKVTLNNGQLSIVAENSNLGDVLGFVRKATGAVVEMPPAAANERVVVNIPPSEPREALQQLLEGSKFDYIIVASPDDQKLQRVVLTARGAGPTTGPAVASGAPASFRPPATDNYQPPPPPPQDEDSSIEDEQPGVPEPASPEIVNMPQETPPGQPNGVPNPNQDPNQGPRTPEQLLQELQQLQQQQNQQNTVQRPSRSDQPPTPR